jgi:hypothetical protein
MKKIIDIPAFKDDYSGNWYCKNDHKQQEETGLTITDLGVVSTSTEDDRIPQDMVCRVRFFDSRAFSSCFLGRYDG